MTTRCEGCRNRDKNINNLERKLRTAESKLKELQDHPTIMAGLKGETLLLHITQGFKSQPGASYDLILRNGEKVEVKYSSTM